ncbi:MAG: hypothetical protein JW893_06985 [Candidatus Omnitrophica bacterium]|nr:hypothetical protein [Candidatus Omnitrophota bacterium]
MKAKSFFCFAAFFFIALRMIFSGESLGDVLTEVKAPQTQSAESAPSDLQGSQETQDPSVEKALEEIKQKIIQEKISKAIQEGYVIEIDGVKYGTEEAFEGEKEESFVPAPLVKTQAFPSPEAVEVKSEKVETESKETDPITSNDLSISKEGNVTVYHNLKGSGGLTHEMMDAALNMNENIVPEKQEEKNDDKTKKNQSSRSKRPKVLISG